MKLITLKSILINFALLYSPRMIAAKKEWEQANPDKTVGTSLSKQKQATSLTQANLQSHYMTHQRQPEADIKSVSTSSAAIRDIQVSPMDVTLPVSPANSSVHSITFQKH